jgi:hypothetical protein
VIRLTHRPAGFNGRRWSFVSETGERAETLFLVDGRFRTERGRADLSLAIHGRARSRAGTQTKDRSAA